jgi:hypothetical protein
MYCPRDANRQRLPPPEAVTSCALSHSCASSCRSRTLHPGLGLRDVRHFLRLLRYLAPAHLGCNCKRTWSTSSLTQPTSTERRAGVEQSRLSSFSQPVLSVLPVQKASSPQKHQGILLDRFSRTVPSNRSTLGAQPIQCTCTPALERWRSQRALCQRCT